ncbi:hypothetical protein B0H11DRAFT_515485 [Mycena galericulata]|nr:hypothetical protein B0H11DRAFT_515485 [Mycena galericulata]
MSDSPSGHVDKSPPPTLPAELIDRIIEIALGVHASLELFGAIALTSPQFRSLAFRHYFRHVILLDGKGTSGWNRFFRVLRSLEDRTGEECFTWVRFVSYSRSNDLLSQSDSRPAITWLRSLRAASQTLVPALTNHPIHPSQSANLAILTHLQELSIDLQTEGFVTQHPFLKLVCRHLLYFLPDNTPHKLTMLTLTAIPRIDIPLLRLIANSFPCLLDLFLSSTERLDFHCWSCYEESLGLTAHSPVPDMFSCSRAMAVVFAKILKSLTRLTHLHLGIYLSDEMLTLTHAVHGQREGGIPFGPEECILCDKASTMVQLRELAAGLEFAQCLKALRTVGFSSFFDRTPYSQSEDRRNPDTTVYVLRENGRIRVRKSPWPNGWLDQK